MKSNYPFSKGIRTNSAHNKQNKQNRKQSNQKNPPKSNKKPKKVSSISNLITKKNRYPIKHKNKSITNTEQRDNNTSFDILNFSKIDVSLNKLRMSNSYSDVFDTRTSNDRYKEIDTPLNTSLMENNINNKKNEILNQTPSTICNYYQPSEQGTAKKTFIDKENSEVKRNLNQLYLNIPVDKDKTIKVNKTISTNKKNKHSSVVNPNVNPNMILKNYLNTKLNPTPSKKKSVNKCKTTSMDIPKNTSLTKNIMIKHYTNANIINTTSKKQPRRLSQQKPLMLYLDQMKYESYFITPNSKRIGKNMTNIKKDNRKTLSAKSTMPSSYSSSKMNKGMTKYNTVTMKNSNGHTHSGVNYLKVSKTLTEQNIINIIQNTPKANKISFLSSMTTNTKNQGYRNSNTHMTMIKVSKAKTQSALKSKNCSLMFNIQNSNEKDVKQKLLDRMNKAIKNNWNYLYKHKGEDKKKILDNISAIIQTPNKEKDTFQGYHNIVQTTEKLNNANDDDNFFDC